MEAEDYGEAIRSLRGSWTQKEAAERGGVNPSSWSLYEQGRRCPSEPQRRKIAKGLGCSLFRLEETAWLAKRQRLQAAEGNESEGPPGQPRELLSVPPSYVEEGEPDELTLLFIETAQKAATIWIEHATEIFFRKWRELQR